MHTYMYTTYIQLAKKKKDNNRSGDHQKNMLYLASCPGKSTGFLFLVVTPTAMWTSACAFYFAAVTFTTLFPQCSSDMHDGSMHL